MKSVEQIVRDTAWKEVYYHVSKNVDSFSAMKLRKELRPTTIPLQDMHTLLQTSVLITQETLYKKRILDFKYIITYIKSKVFKQNNDRPIRIYL